MAKDFLLLYSGRDVSERDGNHNWQRVLGAAKEHGSCMEKWWEEAASGDTPLHDCYRQLAGCTWTVWHVEKANDKRNYLRVMQKTDGGDTEIYVAVHFQFFGEAKISLS